MKILVTGAAGYIGSLLINRLVSDDNNRVVGVDLLPKPAQTRTQKNLFWVTRDLAREGWESSALKNGRPDAVVHLAFKIRSPYGKEEQTKKENIAASGNVFKFAFENKVPRLIYTSSVAAYGAKKENIGRLLKESEPLKEGASPYGTQKRMVEELLRAMVIKFKPVTHTTIVRLNSVTGPVGQGVKSKFGLITFLKKLLPFVVEAHPAWARQFIHERDVENILLKTLRSPLRGGVVDTYNAAPPEFLTAKDIARILKKKTVRIPKMSVRPAFWLAWHATRGIIPTHPDSANGLIYPINVDGSKIRETGFRYQFGPDDALLGKSEPTNTTLA